VMEEDLIFGPDDLSMLDRWGETEVLARQISYFADEAAVEAMLRHLHDSPFVGQLEQIAARPSRREPFATGADLDPGFRDLMCGLMDFDLNRRLTVTEALAHPRFADARDG